MILFNKAYMKVWKIDKKEKYTKLQASTGEKQQDGTYKNSGWNVRLVGKAHDLNLSEGDRIEVKSGKVENVYDKENNRSWLNVIVFDAEVQSSEDGFYPVDSGKDDLPF